MGALMSAQARDLSHGMQVRPSISFLLPTTSSFALMIRFRKTTPIPFTPSQFRIGDPNAIPFSTGSPSALTNFQVNDIGRLISFQRSLSQVMTRRIQLCLQPVAHLGEPIWSYV